MHGFDATGANGATWCGADEAACDVSDRNHPVLRAWDVLARRYCTQPNVLMADVYNEPYGHSWAGWRAFVQTVGAQILRTCPRWLVMAQGVSGEGYWWGENIAGHATEPIVLPVPHRLVLSPHSCAHAYAR